ncbi:uncharacterized protein BJ171DRAFT_574038 [Polychytrium aggregatum]|uniref:uncharacterized protein n=1 Tax=Polychytrium aggregatum TaxID=110093 RepID=UPI0022FE7463|nr:uncharacterized protein BJ171DRAFT_574038 [Polychytrium aggregatum]KAI9190854.1 hypothetical protein BJ171DRAFT_574038 [Polychytrium aggregatum]
MSVRVKMLALQNWARWDDQVSDGDKMLSMILRNKIIAPYHPDQFLGQGVRADPHWAMVVRRQEADHSLTATEIYRGKTRHQPPPPGPPRPQPVPIKTLIFEDHMKNGFDRSKQLTAACTPSTKMSGLWEARGYQGSMIMLMFMVRWRLGALPGHFRFGYRKCKNLARHGSGIDLTRTHAQQCVDPHQVLVRKVAALKTAHPTWVESVSIALPLAVAPLPHLDHLLLMYPLPALPSEHSHLVHTQHHHPLPHPV